MSDNGLQEYSNRWNKPLRAQYANEVREPLSPDEAPWERGLCRIWKYGGWCWVPREESERWHASVDQVE